MSKAVKPSKSRSARARNAHEATPASSTMRMFEILDLFTEETPVWTGTGLEDHFGYTRTTIYRYIKILCDVGLLFGIGKNTYCLGPRIVQLERQIQLTDPLLAAGRLVLPQFIEESPWDVILLCSLCRHSVLCILQQPRSGGAGQSLPIKRARGVPFSLYQGPASLAILAHLKPHQLKALSLRQRHEIAAAGLGDTWVEFRKCLREIRKNGYVAASGTFGSGLAGLAAPTSDSSGRVIGSVTGIMSESEFARYNANTLAQGIINCARQVSKATGSAIPRGVAAVRSARKDKERVAPAKTKKRRPKRAAE